MGHTTKTYQNFLLYFLNFITKYSMPAKWAWTNGNRFSPFRTFPFFIIFTLFSLNQSQNVVDNDGGKLIFNLLSICIFALIELYFFYSFNKLIALLNWEVYRGGKNWIWLPRKILQYHKILQIFFLATSKVSNLPKKKFTFQFPSH